MSSVQPKPVTFPLFIPTAAVLGSEKKKGFHEKKKSPLSPGCFEKIPPLASIMYYLVNQDLFFVHLLVITPLRKWVVFLTV